MGGRLGLIGHGLRRRIQRGPLAPGESPQEVEVLVRRFVCTVCRAVLLVTPAAVLPRRLFSACSVALALALFGVEDRPAHAVRAAVSPSVVLGFTARTGWAQLRRWVAAVRERMLFAAVRPSPPGWTCRRVAERAAMTLAACAPPRHRHESAAAQAWWGATQAT